MVWGAASAPAVHADEARIRVGRFINIHRQPAPKGVRRAEQGHVGPVVAGPPPVDVLAKGSAGSPPRHVGRQPALITDTRVGRSSAAASAPTGTDLADPGGGASVCDVGLARCPPGGRTRRAPLWSYHVAAHLFPRHLRQKRSCAPVNGMRPSGWRGGLTLLSSIRGRWSQLMRAGPI